jgi:uncharacterized protein YaiI (UPF0178 family)
MKILIDADSVPSVIKNILFRAADRNMIQLVLIANQALKFPDSKNISAIVVPAGYNEADDRIEEIVRPGDLVVTDDIPLADRVVRKGGSVIDSRGRLYTGANIGERLALRDMMDELRNSGVSTGGPAPYSSRDRQAFANQLDRFITKNTSS